jgi:hypothetical protein
MRTKTKADDLACEALGRPVGRLIFVIGLTISLLPILSVLKDTGSEFITFDRALRILLALMASVIAWGVYRFITVINYVLERLAESTDNI